MTAISGFGEGVEWDDEWAGIGGGKPKGDSSNAKAHDLGALFQTAVYVQRQESGWRLKPMDRNDDGTAGGYDGHNWEHENTDKCSADSSGKSDSSDHSGCVKYYDTNVSYNHKTGETKLHGEIGVSKGDNKISANVDVNNKGDLSVSVSASGTW